MLIVTEAFRDECWYTACQLTTWNCEDIHVTEEDYDKELDSIFHHLIGATEFRVADPDSLLASY